MRRILSVCVCSVLFCLFLFASAPLLAVDTTEQILTNIDQILAENPLPPGKKFQMIKVAEDNAVTIYVARGTEGTVPPHVHKTHDETIYIIRGAAQMLINDKWQDLGPGSFHFNPMGKVHGLKLIGTPTVAISIFTPAMEEEDRYFIK